MPLAQSVEGIAAAALILRGGTTCGLRFSASRWACAWPGPGSARRTGVTGAVGGMLVAQVLSTAAIGVAGGRVPAFPVGASRALGSDGRDVRRS